MAQGEFVEVGFITGAFGVAGEVRVASSTDNPKKRFKAGNRSVSAHVVLSNCVLTIEPRSKLFALTPSLLMAAGCSCSHPNPKDYWPRRLLRTNLGYMR